MNVELRVSLRFDVTDDGVRSVDADVGEIIGVVVKLLLLSIFEKLSKTVEGFMAKTVEGFIPVAVEIVLKDVEDVSNTVDDSSWKTVENVEFKAF